MIAWLKRWRDERRRKDADRRTQQAIDTAAWITDIGQRDDESREAFAVRLLTALREGPS